MIDRARELREFWFGRLPLGAPELRERMQFWFGAEETAEARRERDQKLRARFGALVIEAAAGKLAAWADSPRRRLSLILLLDQLPRNLYRDTPRAFATDAQALALSLSGIQSGADAALDVVERIFFYMPLQHAESQDVQEESVAAYRRLVAECPADLRTLFEESLESARSHRELIKQFGRFPHRNRVLGRASTAAEEIWLRANPDRFGQ